MVTNCNLILFDRKPFDVQRTLDHSWVAKSPQRNPPPTRTSSSLLNPSKLVSLAPVVASGAKLLGRGVVADIEHLPVDKYRKATFTFKPVPCR